MKIRDLKTRKDMMMVFDANESVRKGVEYLVYENEKQNMDDFLDKFEGIFIYTDYNFICGVVDVSLKPHGKVSSIIEIIDNLDDYDYLPPEFNLHKVLELSNMYIGTDDDIKADEILGDILDEFEEGFKRFCQRVKSRDYLLYSLEKFISCDFDSFEYILDKEIDDDFCIIEEPQTPKMRKFKEASDEDFNKIWKNNPKFVEMIQDAFIQDRQDYLNDTTFENIKGASVYIDVKNNVCLINVYDSKKFSSSILSIPEVQFYWDEDLMEILQKDDDITEAELSKIIGELKLMVNTAHDVTKDETELKDYFMSNDEDFIDEATLYYDDNFVLYRILSFA